ncbi:MAG TPA: phosphoribosylanthranilate isomerase [Armatimonadota bacterium]
MSRTRVKICGITQLDDALLAAELGADALGFIFYPKSPRCVTPEAAREIINQLPPFVTPVAVVVNEPAEEIQRLMTVSGCRALQLHGEESPEFFTKFPWPVIKSLAVSAPAAIAAIARYSQAQGILLDTKVDGAYGGTGRTFNWKIARDARRYGRPIILAGGLTPGNIAEAIRTAEPWAVDVSSGVEREPGRKDHEKLRILFEAIRGEVDA